MSGMEMIFTSGVWRSEFYSSCYFIIIMILAQWQIKKGHLGNLRLTIQFPWKRPKWGFISSSNEWESFSVPRNVMITGEPHLYWYTHDLSRFFNVHKMRDTHLACTRHSETLIHISYILSKYKWPPVNGLYWCCTSASLACNNFPDSGFSKVRFFSH